MVENVNNLIRILFIIGWTLSLIQCTNSPIHRSSSGNVSESILVYHNKSNSNLNFPKTAGVNKNNVKQTRSQVKGNPPSKAKLKSHKFILSKWSTRSIIPDFKQQSSLFKSGHQHGGEKRRQRRHAFRPYPHHTKAHNQHSYHKVRHRHLHSIKRPTPQRNRKRKAFQHNIKGPTLPHNVKSPPHRKIVFSAPHAQKRIHFGRRQPSNTRGHHQTSTSSKGLSQVSNHRPSVHRPRSHLNIKRPNPYRRPPQRSSARFNKQPVISPRRSQIKRPTFVKPRPLIPNRRLHIVRPTPARTQLIFPNRRPSIVRPTLSRHQHIMYNRRSHIVRPAPVRPRPSISKRRPPPATPWPFPSNKNLHRLTVRPTPAKISIFSFKRKSNTANSLPSRKIAFDNNSPSGKVLLSSIRYSCGHSALKGRPPWLMSRPRTGVISSNPQSKAKHKSHRFIPRRVKRSTRNIIPDLKQQVPLFKSGHQHGGVKRRQKRRALKRNDPRLSKAHNRRPYHKVHHRQPYSIKRPTPQHNIKRPTFRKNVKRPTIQHNVKSPPRRKNVFSAPRPQNIVQFGRRRPSNTRVHHRTSTSSKGLSRVSNQQPRIPRTRSRFALKRPNPYVRPPQRSSTHFNKRPAISPRRSHIKRPTFVKPRPLIPTRRPHIVRPTPARPRPIFPNRRPSIVRPTPARPRPIFPNRRPSIVRPTPARPRPIFPNRRPSIVRPTPARPRPIFPNRRPSIVRPTPARQRPVFANRRPTIVRPTPARPRRIFPNRRPTIVRPTPARPRPIFPNRRPSIVRPTPARPRQIFPNRRPSIVRPTPARPRRIFPNRRPSIVRPTLSRPRPIIPKRRPHTVRPTPATRMPFTINTILHRRIVRPTPAKISLFSFRRKSNTANSLPSKTPSLLSLLSSRAKSKTSNSLRSKPPSKLSLLSSRRKAKIAALRSKERYFDNDSPDGKILLSNMRYGGLSAPKVKSRLKTGVTTNCHKPSHIPHGHVKLPHHYRFGAKVTYSCKPGYSLVGIPTHVCTSNGKWTGTAPKCVSKVYNIKGQSDKGEIKKLTDEISDMKETSGGKAVIAGVAIAIIVLLLLTCHCVRAASTRSKLVKKHKAVIDEGLTPAHDVPGICEVSNGLLKTLCCCDSGLPTSFKPHKSKSRLSTSSSRDRQDGGSRTSIKNPSSMSLKRSSQGSLHKVGSKSSRTSSRHKPSMERIYDSDLPYEDFPPLDDLIELPEDTGDFISYSEEEYPEPYIVRRSSRSQNGVNGGNSINGINDMDDTNENSLYYRNDNASLQRRHKYWPRRSSSPIRRNKVIKDRYQRKYASHKPNAYTYQEILSKPYTYRKEKTRGSNKKKLSSLRKMQKMADPFGGGNDQLLVDNTTKSLRSVKKRNGQSYKPISREATCQYRNRNMNTNTEEAVNLNKISYYNESRQVDESTNRYQGINDSFGDGEMSNSVDDTYRCPSPYKGFQFSGRRTDETLANKLYRYIGAGDQFITIGPETNEEHCTARKTKTFSKADKQNGISNGVKKDKFTYGICKTEINLDIHDNKDEEITKVLSEDEMSDKLDDMFLNHKGKGPLDSFTNAEPSTINGRQLTDIPLIKLPGSYDTEHLPNFNDRNIQFGLRSKSDINDQKLIDCTGHEVFKTTARLNTEDVSSSEKNTKHARDITDRLNSGYDAIRSDDKLRPQLRTSLEHVHRGYDKQYLNFEPLEVSNERNKDIKEVKVEFDNVFRKMHGKILDGTSEESCYIRNFQNNGQTLYYISSGDEPTMNENSGLATAVDGPNDSRENKHDKHGDTGNVSEDATLTGNLSEDVTLTGTSTDETKTKAVNSNMRFQSKSEGW